MRSENYNLKMYALCTLFLVFFIAISIVSLNVVKYRLFNSSKVMGQSIAARFIDREMARIHTQEIIIRGAANNVQEIVELQPVNMEEKIQLQLDRYTSIVNEHLTIGIGDMCAVVNGKIIGSTTWDGTNHLEELDWYRDVLESSPGEFVYTDVYRTGRNDGRVLTKALRIANTDNIIVLNIFPHPVDRMLPDNVLPPNSYYYLCDTNGHVIYSVGDRNLPLHELQAHVDHIVSEIRAGVHDNGKTNFVLDSEGNQQGVYFVEVNNGWFSIVTIPHEYILRDYQGLLFWYIITIVAFIIFAIFMYVRNSRMHDTMESMNEVVKILGNVYYAVYRIDYEKGTYVRLKGKRHLGPKFPANGRYIDLLNKMLKYVDKDTVDEFSQTFSLENIRKIVKDKIMDFGGDFRGWYGKDYRWVNIRLLSDEKLKRGEVIMCFREVETEKRIQLEHIQITEDALESIKKTTESKNMFFSSMSHDMRTPLNGIIGLSEIAGKHVNEPEKVAEYLHKINNSSKQLLSLINDILDMSKMEYGKLETNNDPFNLRDSIADYLIPLEMQARKDNKDFIYEYNVEHNLVCGDFPRIGQILNNIISNAIKYTPAGGTIAFSVKEIAFQGTVSKYQFTIADTGYGMTDEFLQKIFTPFERDMRFSARKAMGTGLGMTIVKNLVTQMHGEINISSAVGKGTCVEIKLPLNLQMEGTHCAGEKVAVVDKPHEAVDFTGRKILVAEDNEINMEIVNEILQMKGFEVIQAWNGKEAVEAFAKSEVGEISLILMDMQMPEMDGCTAAETIRLMQRADAKSIPIIALTANAFADDIAATMAAGMNAHISKPINFKTLDKTLATYILD